MPSFSLEFEVYCQTCGYGLCFDTEVVETKNRKEPSIRINVCPICMKEKEDEIIELKKIIEDYEKVYK